MNNVLAQATDTQPPITDNEVLDQFAVPFGNWIDETTSWMNEHLDPVFKAIEWPFDKLLGLVVDDFLIASWMPWFVVVALIAVLGTLTRNVRVGVVSGAAIAFCGLLGNDFWEPTIETIGMVIVAVTICTVIGVPLGILCGRFDSVWNATRPVLDGMQVVHPFVYLLPVIFFFGIGRTPGVLVTMIFALPPLVRLTNLGLRQVPEDVVEASRAYGAPERRVLTDVQLPLARSAIMTGLNQCLLMAISMVGIVALISGGGLGQMVFRGVQNLNTPLAASAGLALYLVAVVLDRMSQRDGETNSLGSRLAGAWRNRKTPENLIALREELVAEEPDSELEHVGHSEHLGAIIGLVAAVGVIVAGFLPWATDGSAVAGYPAVEVLSLRGSSNGFTAIGGSWFGILAFIAAAILVAAAGGPALKKSNWPRSLGPEVALAAAASAFALCVSYVLLNPSGFSGDEYRVGVGPYVGLVAGAIAVVGAGLQMVNTPLRPRRVGTVGMRGAQIVSMGAAAALIVAGSIGTWVFDERTGILPAETQAQIDELRENAVTPADKAAVAVEVARLSRTDDTVRTLQGFDANGPGLALPFAAFGLAACLVGIAASLPQLAGGKRRWALNAIAFSLATAASMIPLAWIVTLVRISPARFYSGAGTFGAVIGATLIVLITSATFGNWIRIENWRQSAEETFTELEEAA